MFKKLVPVLSLGLMFLAGPMVFAAPTPTDTTTTHHTSKMKSHHHSSHTKSHHHKTKKKPKPS